MSDFYTENLADFGIREIRMLQDILDAWLRYGLPGHFENDRVRAAMNRINGSVYLVNDNMQIAMMNGEHLDILHYLPYGGAEGFLSVLVNDYTPGELHRDDVDYILNAMASVGLELPAAWSSLKATTS